MPRVDNSPLAFRYNIQIAQSRNYITATGFASDHDRLLAPPVNAALRMLEIKAVRLKAGVHIVTLKVLAIGVQLNLHRALFEQVHSKRNHYRGFSEVLLNIAFTLSLPIPG